MVEAPDRHHVHPCFTEPAVIPGLPDHLQRVPEDPAAWGRWQGMVAAHREIIRRACLASSQQRQFQRELCRRDPAYFMTMFGVVFEPRDVGGRPPQWMPFIPFHFQVQFVRFWQHVMTQNEQGRGDAVVEKSREMGFTWMMCVIMAWAWLFEDNFICGIISRTEELVDKAGKTDTIFSKIRAQLGIERGIPAHLRLPKFLLPDGFDPAWSGPHNKLRTLIHPTKTNTLQGETTTEMAGVSGRATMRFNDELARFREAQGAWGNQQAVTLHRWGGSSADTASGMFFYNLARRGEAALNDPELPGPSFARLDYWLHPFHTEEWLMNEKARAEDPVVFAREYEIDYFAGQGDYVYPRALSITPGHYPFDPRLGPLYCFIDPGVADPTAVGWVQEDVGAGRFRVIDGFENDGTEDAEFMASVLTGVPISNTGYDYAKYPGIEHLMDWLYNLRRPITYVGDPAGNSRSGDGKRSYFEALRDKSSELTHKGHVIRVATLTQVQSALDEKARSARYHTTRKINLNRLLPRLDINDTPGAIRILTALQRSRYPELKAGASRTVERLEPLHDEHSHLRSGMEYLANHIANTERITRPVAQERRTGGIRLNMSGRRIR